MRYAIYTVLLSGVTAAIAALMGAHWAYGLINGVAMGVCFHWGRKSSWCF